MQLTQFQIFFFFCTISSTYGAAYDRGDHFPENEEEKIRGKLIANGPEHEPKTPVEELDAAYWLDMGLKNLDATLKLKDNTGRAKNVIFFLGDGMSFQTVAAARILKGQQENQPGEETRLVFEDFPSVGIAKSYCTDLQVAESACAATAFLTGVKAPWGTIGVTGKARYKDCMASLNQSNQVSSIAKWAQDAGKLTGVITNRRITDATPAGAYARTSNRFWECDSDLPPNSPCKDIAAQLVLDSPGNAINVLMGGGKDYFLPKGLPHNGRRSDGQNLIKKWREGKKDRRATFASNREELLSVDSTETDDFLGLFTPSHMSYHHDADHSKEPTLTEMTQKAIEILSKGPNGFFLLVEGGLIDPAHHTNYAHKALVETIEFEKAIEKALLMADTTETLIIVTADHAHSLNYNGFALRGSPILGFTGFSNVDMKPYTTLSYSNGPAPQKYGLDGTRHNYTNDHTKDYQYQMKSMVPLGYSSHGGEDVGVYAIGPWSHLLDGQFDQTYIPIVMAHAAAIGPSASERSTSSSASMSVILGVTYAALLLRT